MGDLAFGGNDPRVYWLLVALTLGGIGPWRRYPLWALVHGFVGHIFTIPILIKWETGHLTIVDLAWYSLTNIFLSVYERSRKRNWFLPILIFRFNRFPWIHTESVRLLFRNITEKRWQRSRNGNTPESGCTGFIIRNATRLCEVGYYNCLFACTFALFIALTRVACNFVFLPRKSRHGQIFSASGLLKNFISTVSIYSATYKILIYERVRYFDTYSFMKLLRSTKCLQVVSVYFV